MSVHEKSKAFDSGEASEPAGPETLSLRERVSSRTPAAKLTPKGRATAIESVASVGTGPVRPKRVLFFGKRKSRSVCTGALVDALRQNGLEVRWVNCSTIKRWVTKAPMRQIVRWIYARYRPDLVFVFFHDLPPVLMREFSMRTPTVVWMEEPLQQIMRSQLEYVQHARLLCLSTPDLVEAYREMGIPHATFQMSGFSPAFHKPHSALQARERKGSAAVPYERDLAYIGGPGEIEDRPGFLAWLTEQGCDLEIFGKKDTWLPYLRKYRHLRFGGEARPSRYAEICAKSRIVLGMNQTHDSYLYFSNRVFLTLACQGFHLTHHVPGVEQLFVRGEHLDWFEDREECLERIRFWLARDDERRHVARRGHELVLAQHTYARRVKEILEILAEERPLACPQPDSGKLLHPYRRPDLVRAEDVGSEVQLLPHVLGQAKGPESDDELLAVRVLRKELSTT